MDDIFKVEANKLGGGLFFDGYLGFGIQMYDHRITGQPSNHGFYLKGAEVGLGYGYFLAYNFDLLEKWKSTWKFFNIRAYINLVAQIQGRLGFKSYNFKRNGTFNTKYGFFFQAMLQGKAGAGINLMETDFAHGDENNPNPGEGQIIDDGNDEGDIIPAAPARRANKASRGTWLNRLFSAAIGVRGGGKAQADELLHHAPLQRDGQELHDPVLREDAHQDVTDPGPERLLHAHLRGYALSQLPAGIVECSCPEFLEGAQRSGTCVRSRQVCDGRTELSSKTVLYGRQQLRDGEQW